MSSKELELSQEQQDVFNKIVKDKKNIFFTGCAGTGKSFLTRRIIEHYRASFKDPQALAITASTGRAAFNIGGSTLHSFVGVGLGNNDIQKLISIATYNKKTANRWKKVQVLIIDEISMLDSKYFDIAETIARSIRKSNKPFGGIQLILTGDLLQLPPVSDNNSSKDSNKIHVRLSKYF